MRIFDQNDKLLITHVSLKGSISGISVSKKVFQELNFISFGEICWNSIYIFNLQNLLKYWRFSSTDQSFGIFVIGIINKTYFITRNGNAGATGTVTFFPLMGI